MNRRHFPRAMQSPNSIQKNDSGLWMRGLKGVQAISSSKTHIEICRAFEKQAGREAVSTQDSDSAILELPSHV